MQLTFRRWNKALGDFTHRSAEEQNAVDELDAYVLVDRFEIGMANQIYHAH